MRAIGERMPDRPTLLPKTSNGIDQIIGHGQHRRCRDRRFQSRPSLLRPAGDECSIAELGDRLDGQEQLIPGQARDRRLQLGPWTT
jgi:hypothetical protein